MADETYSTVNTYLDNNINTNNANAITGAKHNVAEKKLLAGLAGKVFDSTRPYKTGNLLSYNDATFGYEEWVAPGDVAAAAWNSASFTRLSKRSEKLTASTTPYTGIESGTHTYAHNMGHVNIAVFARDSSNAPIEVDIQGISTTHITIYSAQNYASGYLLIQEIIIP